MFDSNKIVWLVVLLVVVGIVVMLSRSANENTNLNIPVEESTMMKNSSDESALTSVSELAEVVEFKNAVEEGGRSTFHVERENFGAAPQGTTAVRVFEIFPDHQTTFGRYAVDENSKIYRYDGVNDTWVIKN